MTVDMRQAVSVAMVSGNLAFNDAVYEMPVERVAALGFADELGVALWRIKYASPIIRSSDRRQIEYRNIQELTKSALYLLAKRISDIGLLGRCKKSGDDLINRFCAQCLIEWLYDKCHACLGRRWLAVTRHSQHSVPRICNVCNGTGSSRVSGAERARAIGVSREAYRRHWERKFDQAMQIIQYADISTNSTCCEQLEKKFDKG